MPEFPRISKRIAAIAESATLKVDAKAKSLQAAGRPVISYAAGEPDFATPAHIVEAALAAVKDPKNHRYTQAVGLPELREAIAHKTLIDSGTQISAAQVVVTNGGKQAVYQAFATIVDPGDEAVERGGDFRRLRRRGLRRRAHFLQAVDAAVHDCALCGHGKYSGRRED